MTETDILIVGLGPTGLGAAWRLSSLGHHEWLACEAEAEAGGLAGSHIDDHGFTWDYGGHVQFSHYQYFDELMDELLGVDGWHYHDRESWVWICSRFVPYPFQLNIHRLPEPEQGEALDGLRHAARAESATPANFGEWIDQVFGPGIAKSVHAPVQHQGLGASTGTPRLALDRRSRGDGGCGARRRKHSPRTRRCVVGSQ